MLGKEGTWACVGWGTWVVMSSGFVRVGGGRVVVGGGMGGEDMVLTWTQSSSDVPVGGGGMTWHSGR